MEAAPFSTFGTLTAKRLGEMAFEPLRYVVPNLLPEGLALLAGKPKLGKSFLALDLAVSVAAGAMAMGSVSCEAGDVLYLAGEDSERRLQDRIRKMLQPGDDMPERLCLETRAMRVDEGLTDALRGWLHHRPGARLVILDTWATVKPVSTGRASAYDEDAAGLRPLHELALAHPGLAVLVIHHTRKAESDDVFDTISGTRGLTGVADTLMVLARDGEQVRLTGQGRDIDPFDKALKRNTWSGSWSIIGDARELAKTGERQAILDLLAEAEGETLTTSQVARAIGKRQDAASYLLNKLLKDGQVSRPAYGKWTLAPPSKSSIPSNWDDEQSCEAGDFVDFERFEGVRP